MSCPTNHPNEQKAQAQVASAPTPNNIAVSKLCLSHTSNGDHKKIVISSVTTGCKIENKIPLKLVHPGDFDLLQLSYKGSNFHHYFPPNVTVKVSEMLLKKSTTKKNKFSLEELHNGSWNIVHINTKKKSDCNYLFTQAIKDKYTIILTVLLEIINVNNSSRQLTLYLNGVDDLLLHRAVTEKDIKIIKALLKCELNVNARNKNHWTPLHVAIDLEMSDVVDLLISSGADINAKNNEHQVPLHLAAEKNNLKILDSLLQNQARLDEEDKNGRTPLFYAVAAKNENVIDFLLKKGANYRLTDKSDHTAFHLAVNPQNLNIIEIFLKNNADADILNLRKQTPLFYVSLKSRFSQVDVIHKVTYLKIINTFLKKGANINCQDLEGRTPLYISVMNNNIECIQAFLECKADVNIQDKSGRNVLHVACQWSKNKCLQILLNSNININAVDVNNKTALHIAVEAKNYIAVDLLLKKNVNINMRDKQGETALHIALESECLPIIELLLKNKADVNLKDKLGRTALHVALENPKITMKIIKTILNFTTDINAVDVDNKTALHVAVEEDNYCAVKLILEKSPNVNIKDKFENTPLHFALLSICLPIIEILLKNKADVNLKDAHGRVALHLASQNPNIPISLVKTILNYSSDIHAKNSFGATPVHFAAYNHNVKTIKFLIEQNADVNFRDSDGRTPLHIAVNPQNEFTSCFKCVKTLLDYKADVNAVDKDSVTPLHLACFAKNAKVVKYLIKNGADPSMRDKNKKTVFHYASMLEINKQLLWINEDIEKNIEDTLNLLVEENISVNCVDKFGKTPLHYVAENHGLFFTHEQLLNIGADINIENKNHKSPFDILVKHNTHIYDSLNGLFLLYSKHIMKMKVMKMWVREKTLDKIYKVDNEDWLKWIQIYERTCKEEIDLMKTTILDQSNISYYDFLKKSQHDAVNFIHNQNIVKAIKSDGLMFPTYGYFLKSHLRQIQRRNNLYEEIQESLEPYIFKELPNFCMREILGYLNNSELAMLLEAIKSIALIN